MRHLLCATCAKDKQNGTRQIYARSPIGEPAEFERIVWGVAKTPTAEQRTMSVNGEPMTLTAGQFDCDLCNAPIRPGERACAQSVWAEGGMWAKGIGHWESEFLELS
jgi:hypothetical protein